MALPGDIVIVFSLGDMYMYREMTFKDKAPVSDHMSSVYRVSQKSCTFIKNAVGSLILSQMSMKLSHIHCLQLLLMVIC